MEKKFIGRKNELELLRSVSNSPKSQITAIYGRRRVGKTRLVKEAYKGYNILQFEGLEGIGTSGQKAHFLNTIQRISKSDKFRLISKTADWADLLILLAEYVKKEPCVIFFDEFQWMAAGRNELVSKLKYVWDNYFSEQCSVHLILCGSVSSFLVKKVIRSKALYGRIENIINLQPLPFCTVKKGFLEKRNILEALEYYLIVGGIPKYIEMYNNAASLRLNLQNLCFTPNSYLLEECNRIFVSHFGDTPVYSTIIKFLARKKFSTRDNIAKHIKAETGGRITEYLDNLELAGFIESYTPVHLKSTYLKRFRISDPYIRFYYHFISSLKNRILQNMQTLPLHQALPDNRYAVYLGLSFECFCFQHSTLIAERLGFSAVTYNYGAYYMKGDTPKAVQIDLLFERADKVITVCEIKFKRNIGREVIKDMERKINILSNHYANYSIEPVLISAYQPSDYVVTEGYFSAILTASDFCK